MREICARRALLAHRGGSAPRRQPEPLSVRKPTTYYGISCNKEINCFLPVELSCSKGSLWFPYYGTHLCWASSLMRFRPQSRIWYARDMREAWTLSVELYFESSHLTTGGSTVRKSSISLLQEAPQKGNHQFPYYRRLHSKEIVNFLTTGGSTARKSSISLLQEAPQ